MRRILAPTDFSETAAAALAKAVELSTAGDTIIVLHSIHSDKIKEELLGLDALEYLAAAMDEPPKSGAYAPPTYVDGIREVAERKLNEVAAGLAKEQVKVETAVVEGRPSSAIVEYASKNGVDLIVMGTHGRGPVMRAFLGSVAENVIREAQCPVMVVRQKSN